MLKPIAQPLCCGALQACRRLQQQFTDWLCDPAVNATDITLAYLLPPRLPTQIEAEWLWAFLQREFDKKPLLLRAQTLADMPEHDKTLLRGWVDEAGKLLSQFQRNPPAWPVEHPAISAASWQAYKELMGSFYEKGFRAGLPYSENGTPVNDGGVTYAQFVRQFREAHRNSENPDASEACVLCGGPLENTPPVDHWIAESRYPIFSVCSDNLLVICGTCNPRPNKGDKPVYSDTIGGNAFANWFHPYLRPACGSIGLHYNVQTLTITCSALNPSDTEKVANLDKLLDLSNRWTRQFKAEYFSHADELRRREQIRLANNQPRYTQAEIVSHIKTEQAVLSPTRPHYEVHRTVFDALLEQARLDAWQTELGLVK